MLQDCDYNNIGSGSSQSGRLPSPRARTCYTTTDSICINYQPEYYIESASEVSGYYHSEFSRVPLLENENGSGSCDYQDRGSSRVVQAIHGKTRNNYVEETDLWTIHTQTLLHWDHTDCDRSMCLCKIVTDFITCIRTRIVWSACNLMLRCISVTLCYTHMRYVYNDVIVNSRQLDSCLQVITIYSVGYYLCTIITE